MVQWNPTPLIRFSRKSDQLLFSLYNIITQPSVWVMRIQAFITSDKIACEQAPKWGMGWKEKTASWASGARYGGFLSELDFCPRPIPNLGACLQASDKIENENYVYGTETAEMTTWACLSFICLSLFSVSRCYWVLLCSHERPELFCITLI